MKYDIFGIGNALIDFLIEVEDKELSELNLKKGQFHLIDEANSKKLLKRIKKYKVKIAPGGSSANTLYGAATLGCKVVFCGMVGNDDHGIIYEKKMIEKGIKPKLARSEKITGHAITFVTPDSERTFATHLGASLDLKKEHIFFEDLKNSKILHIGGYQLEDKNLRNVALQAMQFAKKHNIKISIDLADPGIVARNKKDIKKIIEKYADIVFANEDEAEALTDLDGLDALNKISKLTEISILKIGKRGSYIKQGNKLHKIQSYKANTIDTTGAGDMFAAGFLHGVCKDHDLKTCGEIGSYFAAKVCEQIGARLDSINKEEIEKLIKDID